MVDPKDLKIDTTFVQQDMEADPDIGETVKRFTTSMRQAFEAVQRGQYRTIDEALLALGIRIKKVDLETGEEIEGASMQDDLEASGIMKADDEEE